MVRLVSSPSSTADLDGSPNCRTVAVDGDAPRQRGSDIAMTVDVPRFAVRHCTTHVARVRFKVANDMSSPSHAVFGGRQLGESRRRRGGVLPRRGVDLAARSRGTRSFSAALPYLRLGRCYCFGDGALIGIAVAGEDEGGSEAGEDVE